LALAVLLPCFGAVYETIGGWRDAHRFSQRGKSVQAGPMKLNLNCNGQGSPTVILDSGSGVPSVDWIKVQPEVAKFARVCSYDRAGYGWSEPGPEPGTSLQIAKELKTLLDVAGEKGPYLLVGHSFGGFNVRVFNGQYPKDVAGVVLVDASDEDEEERVESTLSPAMKTPLENKWKGTKSWRKYLPLSRFTSVSSVSKWWLAGTRPDTFRRIYSRNFSFWNSNPSRRKHRRPRATRSHKAWLRCVRPGILATCR
jgi:pimeloyl-ACP methyl ester carboxylesterase